MTLQEAIKSGKTFGRKSQPGITFNISKSNTRPNYFSIDDLIADDWEVEEEKLEITLSQLEKAWDETFSYDTSGYRSTNFRELKLRLGFK